MDNEDLVYEEGDQGFLTFSPTSQNAESDDDRGSPSLLKVDYEDEGGVIPSKPRLIVPESSDEDADNSVLEQNPFISDNIVTRNKTTNLPLTASTIDDDSDTDIEDIYTSETQPNPHLSKIHNAETQVVEKHEKSKKLPLTSAIDDDSDTDIEDIYTSETQPNPHLSKIHNAETQIKEKQKKSQKLPLTSTIDDDSDTDIEDIYTSETQPNPHLSKIHNAETQLVEKHEKSKKLPLTSAIDDDSDTDIEDIYTSETQPNPHLSKIHNAETQLVEKHEKSLKLPLTSAIDDDSDTDIEDIYTSETQPNPHLSKIHNAETQIVEKQKKSQKLPLTSIIDDDSDTEIEDIYTLETQPNPHLSKIHNAETQIVEKQKKSKKLPLTSTIDDDSDTDIEDIYTSETQPNPHLSKIHNAETQIVEKQKKSKKLPLTSTIDDDSDTDIEDIYTSETQPNPHLSKIHNAETQIVEKQKKSQKLPLTFTIDDDSDTEIEDIYTSETQPNPHLSKIHNAETQIVEKHEKSKKLSSTSTIDNDSDTEIEDIYTSETQPNPHLSKIHNAETQIVEKQKKSKKLPLTSTIDDDSDTDIEDIYTSETQPNPHLSKIHNAETQIVEKHEKSKKLPLTSTIDDDSDTDIEDIYTSETQPNPHLSKIHNAETQIVEKNSTAKKLSLTSSLDNGEDTDTTDTEEDLHGCQTQRNTLLSNLFNAETQIVGKGTKSFCTSIPVCSKIDNNEDSESTDVDDDICSAMTQVNPNLHTAETQIVCNSSKSIQPKTRVCSKIDNNADSVSADIDEDIQSLLTQKNPLISLNNAEIQIVEKNIKAGSIESADCISVLYKADEPFKAGDISIHEAETQLIGNASTSADPSIYDADTQLTSTCCKAADTSIFEADTQLVGNALESSVPNVSLQLLSTSTANTDTNSTITDDLQLRLSDFSGSAMNSTLQTNSADTTCADMASSISSDGDPNDLIVSVLDNTFNVSKGDIQLEISSGGNLAASAISYDQQVAETDLVKASGQSGSCKSDALFDVNNSDTQLDEPLNAGLGVQAAASSSKSLPLQIRDSGTIQDNSITQASPMLSSEGDLEEINSLVEVMWQSPQPVAVEPGRSRSQAKRVKEVLAINSEETQDMSQDEASEASVQEQPHDKSDQTVDSIPEKRRAGRLAQVKNVAETKVLNKSIKFPLIAKPPTSSSSSALHDASQPTVSILEKHRAGRPAKVKNVAETKVLNESIEFPLIAKPPTSSSFSALLDANQPTVSIPQKSRRGRQAKMKNLAAPGTIKSIPDGIIPPTVTATVSLRASALNDAAEPTISMPQKCIVRMAKVKNVAETKVINTTPQDCIPGRPTSQPPESSYSSTCHETDQPTVSIPLQPRRGRQSILKNVAEAEKTDIAPQPTTAASKSAALDVADHPTISVTPVTLRRGSGRLWKVTNAASKAADNDSASISSSALDETDQPVVYVGQMPGAGRQSKVNKDVEVEVTATSGRSTRHRTPTWKVAELLDRKPRSRKSRLGEGSSSSNSSECAAPVNKGRVSLEYSPVPSTSVIKPAAKGESTEDFIKAVVELPPTSSKNIAPKRNADPTWNAKKDVSVIVKELIPQTKITDNSSSACTEGLTSITDGKEVVNIVSPAKNSLKRRRTRNTAQMGEAEPSNNLRQETKTQQAEVEISVTKNMSRTRGMSHLPQSADKEPTMSPPKRGRLGNVTVNLQTEEEQDIPAENRPLSTRSRNTTPRRTESVNIQQTVVTPRKSAPKRGRMINSPVTLQPDDKEEITQPATILSKRESRNISPQVVMHQLKVTPSTSLATRNNTPKTSPAKHTIPLKTSPAKRAMTKHTSEHPTESAYIQPSVSSPARSSPRCVGSRDTAVPPQPTDVSPATVVDTAVPPQPTDVSLATVVARPGRKRGSQPKAKASPSKSPPVRRAGTRKIAVPRRFTESVVDTSLVKNLAAKRGLPQTTVEPQASPVNEKAEENSSSSGASTSRASRKSAVKTQPSVSRASSKSIKSAVKTQPSVSRASSMSIKSAVKTQPSVSRASSMSIKSAVKTQPSVSRASSLSIKSAATLALPMRKTPRVSQVAGTLHASQYRVLSTTHTPDEAKIHMVKLGGSLVEDVKDANVVIVAKMRRTTKMLCCIALGIPIVGMQWALALTYDRNADPWKYILKDKGFEDMWKVSLEDSLKLGRSQKVLQGWRLHCTSQTVPGPLEVKQIVESCGATYLKSVPAAWPTNSFVVSSLEDRNVWPRLKNPRRIVSTEFIMAAALTQRKLVLKDYVLT